jgi:hypothetical protein
MGIYFFLLRSKISRTCKLSILFLPFQFVQCIVYHLVTPRVRHIVAQHLVQYHHQSTIQHHRQCTIQYHHHHHTHHQHPNQFPTQCTHPLPRRRCTRSQAQTIVTARVEMNATNTELTVEKFAVARKLK